MPHHQRTHGKINSYKLYGVIGLLEECSWAYMNQRHAIMGVYKSEAYSELVKPNNHEKNPLNKHNED